MAYTNLTKLKDIEAINLSFQNLTSPETAIAQLQATPNAEMGNVWFIAAILLIFIMLIWWFYREDRRFSYDITRSILISSSWCLFITTAFLLSNWINTVIPIIWFATIFTISAVAIMKLKERNL